MPFEFDTVYLIYLFVALSAGLFVEGIYLLCFSGAAYRQNVNRRLKLLTNEPNRENILVQLRRERGLSSVGGYSIGIESLNRLLLQSGLTIGMRKLFIYVVGGAIVATTAGWIFRQDLIEAGLIGVFSGTLLPLLILHMIRKRRQKHFGAQFPDALDMIVRSLRAGHPVPIAISTPPSEEPAR